MHSHLATLRSKQLHAKLVPIQAFCKKVCKLSAGTARFCLPKYRDRIKREKPRIESESFQADISNLSDCIEKRSLDQFQRSLEAKDVLQLVELLSPDLTPALAREVGRQDEEAPKHSTSSSRASRQRKIPKE